VTRKTGDKAKAEDAHPGSFEARIRDQYARLPKSERKIADLILEFPGEVAAYSATELADLAGSSKAAVTRLIRRLGFKGYEQARRAAREAQNWGSPLYLIPRTQSSESGEVRLQNHIEQDMRSISKTFESLSANQLDQIVKAMWRAQRVFVLGYRNSHYLAGYLRSQMLQAREQVYLLPESGETLAEHLSEIGADDLFIVVGLRRRVKEIRLAIETAAIAGAKILYITDSTAGYPSNVTWTIHCAVRGDDLFDRYSGAISLLHYLAVALIDLSGDEGLGRLKDIERLHETLHDFD